MGRNLAQLFTQLADMPDEEIKLLHPEHNQATIRSLLPRLKHFTDGTCIVHHVFGGEVCELVKKGYADAYLTAHFEVPGEMFTLAMQAKARGMGVVGSTSNILDFIAGKVAAASAEPLADRLQFVLGTEAGMITSIVRKVQGMLQAAGRNDLEVEIVFPVAPQAITTAKQSRGDGLPAVELPGGLAVVPGPAMGEGCSLEGGCAACPYMKMNTLAALQMVCERVGSAAGEAMLEPYKPKPYAETIGGKSVAQAGCVPILHMRHFTKEKCLSKQLVDDIESRYQRVQG
jgi:quinolinate synthase